jgi:hypothetical protein
VDLEILCKFADAAAMSGSGRKTFSSVEGAAPAGSVQRLIFVGVLEDRTAPPKPTEFGRDLVRVLARAIDEAREQRRAASRGSQQETG